MRGRITVQLTIWCGCRCGCWRWMYLDTRTRGKAHVEAKASGWALTRAFGWLCKQCANDDCGAVEIL